MSDIAEPNSPGMFDPEKGFYEAGEIVMAAQELVIQEQATMVVNAAETLLWEETEAMYRQNVDSNLKPTANVLELGIAVVGSIVAVSILESLFGKSPKNNT